ncbi:Glutathione S-transferase omega-1 [Cercospora beticola]|uniref:Glutathione S-transferase omega-1 n=1 Tax=Cercospora beticola TaxID=122368 RepID=A0A2G5HZ20_CERBT|nr:Glutathione S-transferase omega-1 [Cercospora beticola]PIA97776.1 Glutathione S-transferase omega-1 [Cercospora beticola]WPA98149.1 hypothetical protein RHO25_002760 [Cercospora beticola]CAK1359366.1 unnamed protein product [Cercospora beticola]
MGSHPDANLHPVATGPAKAIVDAHQAEQPLKLYSGWFCPFVQRIWTLLEEKKIPYQYIEVNPYNKPASLLSLNPRGLVPTLQYNNQPLYESTIVAEFLEDAFPDHGPNLRPKDPYETARMRIWINFFTEKVVTSFHKFLQWQPMSDGEGLERVRGEFLGTLYELAKAGGEEKGGPFWRGEEPLLIDFVVAPWMVRLWVFDEFKGGLGLPVEGGEGDDEVWRRLSGWIRALEERESVRDTMSERKYYLPIYQRYADDVAQSELAKATRQGGRVP